MSTARPTSHFSAQRGGLVQERWTPVCVTGTLLDVRDPADRTNPPLPGTHSRRRPMDVQDPTADAERSIPRTALIVTLATAFVLLIAVGGLLPVGASAATSGFVQRCGIHFCLDGHTYYFAGAN